MFSVFPYSDQSEYDNRKIGDTENPINEGMVKHRCVRLEIPKSDEFYSHQIDDASWVIQGELKCLGLKMMVQFSFGQLIAFGVGHEGHI